MKAAEQIARYFAGRVDGVQPSSSSAPTVEEEVRRLRALQRAGEPCEREPLRALLLAWALELERAAELEP